MTAALLAPFLFPYYLAQREQGLTRSLDEVARYSSTWRDYLSTAGRLHYAAWSHRFFDGTTSLFPGLVASVLALVALGAKPRPAGRPDPDARRDWRRRRRAVVRPGSAGLRRALPLAARCCRACGAPRGSASSRSSRSPCSPGSAWPRCASGAEGAAGWPVAAAIVIAAVNAEALRAPIAYRPFDGIPRIYRRSRRSVGRAVAEFPFFPGGHLPQRAVRAELDRALEAAGQRLQRVHAGELRGIAGALLEFPDDRSRAELHRLGVTHVVVHLDAYGDRADAMASALRDVPWLTLVAAEGAVRIYRLVTS